MRLFVLNTFFDTDHRSKKITSGAPYIAESQGQFYSAVDLGELAAELDTMERRRMAEVTKGSSRTKKTVKKADIVCFGRPPPLNG